MDRTAQQEIRCLKIFSFNKNQKILFYKNSEKFVEIEDFKIILNFKKVTKARRNFSYSLGIFSDVNKENYCEEEKLFSLKFNRIKLF